MQCLTGTETLGQLLAGAPLQPKRPTEPKVVLQLPDSPELAAGWVEVACTVYRTRKLLLAPQQQRDLPTHICAHNRWRAASDDNSAMPPAKIPTRKDPPTLRVRVPPDPWSAEDDRKLAKFVAESTWNSWSPYPTDKAWQHIDWRDIAESMIPRTPRQCRERFIGHLREGVRRAKIDARRKKIALQVRLWEQQSHFCLQSKPVGGTWEQYQIAVAWAISQRKKHKLSVKKAVQAAKAKFGIDVAAKPVRLGALPNKPGRPREDGASSRHYPPRGEARVRVRMCIMH